MTEAATLPTLGKSDAPSLILFSGPPGVGKSSLSYKLARHTGWVVLTKDQFDRTFERLHLSNYPRSTAYELMFDLAELNLCQGVSVILDAVFPLPDFRQRALKMAKRSQATFYPVVCSCSNRQLWQQRLENRPQMVQNWTPVGWEEALRVEAYYEPWQSPHLSLDASQPFDTNFQALLDFVLPTAQPEK